MAVFRIKTNENYTKMANFHFRDKSLSWKAKGILSNMLSLPDNWDYSLAGLQTLASDGMSATRSAIKELEEHGYLIRKPIRENGRISDWEYIIFENPQQAKQFVENQVVENQQVENHTQLITKELNTNQLITKVSNTKDTASDIAINDIVQAYNNSCVDLPKVKALTDKRKRAIKSRSKKYSLEQFTTVFEKAQASDFLSGRSGKWTGANFDWLINENNMIKVLEGNYDNKQQLNPFNAEKDYTGSWE